MPVAYTAGIRNLVVMVNKMDHSTVGFCESRYLEVVQDVGRLVK